MDATPQTRRLRLTSDLCVLLILLVEALLFLSNWLAWPAWHKGYAVLTCVAVVGAAMMAMLAWFVVAVILRRQFQFGVRTLLVLTVAVALPFSWLGVEIKKAREQYAAVACIEKLAGLVWYDWQSEDDPFIAIEEPPQPKSLRSVLGDLFFEDANAVYLCDDFIDEWQGEVMDGMMEKLASLPRLRCLNVSGTKITDRGLEHLTRLTSLRALYLGRCCDITDEGLESIQRMTRLRHLNLERTKVTEPGVRKLRQALSNCDIRWQLPRPPAPMFPRTEPTAQSSNFGPSGVPIGPVVR